MNQKLTARQLQITLLVISGIQYQDLCAMLDIAYQTMKNTMWHVRAKLDVLDNAAIPRRLVELGYVAADKLPVPVARRSVTLCSGQEGASRDKDGK